MKVCREVTGEDTYTTKVMSRKDYKMPKEDIEKCRLSLDLDMSKKNSVSIWGMKEDTAKVGE